MSTNIPPEVGPTIVAAVAKCPNGATLKDIIAAFSPPASRRSAQRWASQLVTRGVLRIDLAAKEHRYFATDAAAAYINAAVSPTPAPQAQRAVPAGADGAQPADAAANTGGSEPARPQGAGVPPATNPAASVPPETSAAAAAKPLRFDALFDEMVFQIVGGVMPPESALPALQIKANQSIPDPAQRRPFVQFGLVRLSQLSLEEARRYGLESTQYELWRRHYPAAASEPTAAPATPAPPPAPAAAASRGTGPAQGSQARWGHRAPPNTAQPASPAPRAPSTDRRQPSANGNGIANDVPERVDADQPANPAPRASSTDRAQPPAKGNGVANDAPEHVAAVQPASPATGAPSTDRRQPPAKGDGVANDVPGRVDADQAVPTPTGAPKDVAALLANPIAGITRELQAFFPGLTPTLAWIAGAAAAGLVGMILAPYGRWSWSAILPPAIVLIGTLSFAKFRSASGARRGGQTAATVAPVSAPQGVRVSVSRSLRPLLLATGSLALLAALVVAGYRYWQTTTRPSASAVREYLNGTLLGFPARVAAVDVTYGPAGATGVSLSYQARLETTEPLYQTVDARQSLRTLAGADLAALDAAGVLLRGPTGSRLRNVAGPAPTPSLFAVLAAPEASGMPAGAAAGRSAQTGAAVPAEAPSDAILVATETPTGASVVTSGTLTAWRSNGTWVFKGTPVIVDRTGLAGEPRASGSAMFAIDQPADVARLKVLLAAHVAYAAKVQAAATTVAEETKSGKLENRESEKQAPSPGEGQKTGGPEDQNSGRPEAQETGPESGNLGDRESEKQGPRPGEGRKDRGAEVQNSGRPEAQKTGGTADQTDAVAAETPNTKPESSNSAPAGGVVGEGESESGRAPSAGGTPDSVSAAMPALPALPTARGAYVLSEGRWLPLPVNNGRTVQTVAQALTSKLLNAKRLEDALAGRPADPPKSPVAQLVFDGAEAVPAVPRDNVTIVCIGAEVPTPAQIQRYPELKDYPVIELAAMKSGTNGMRSAPLFPVTWGVVGFGASRVAAKTEQPAADATLLRCTVRLESGRYALWGGPTPYELAVR